MIEAAIKHWEELTCLTFEQLPTGSTYNGNYILFTNVANDG